MDDNIAHISLNRKPVNAFSLEFLNDLLSALGEAGADDGVRAVILSSEIPKRFSAGLDLDIIHQKPRSEIKEFLEKLYVQLWDVQCKLGKPSIAVVNGAARGGGMTLAISCDVILAGESASFGYPEIDLGLLPAIHLAHLPRLVGRSRAFELLFSGRVFSSEEAERIGLVTRRTPDAVLLDEAKNMAAQFAGKSPEAMRLGRAAFVRASDKGYKNDIRNAVSDFCQSATSDSAQEGLEAFLEKRQPHWNKQGRDS